MIRRVICLAVIALLVLFIVVGLLPQRYWTAARLPYRQYAGTFAGRPVLLAVPSLSGAAVPAEYEIEMSSGVCEIAGIDCGGQETRYCTMGRGSGTLNALPPGGHLRLDPRANAGRYVARIGLKYHPLSPFLWRVLAIGALIGLALVLVARLLWNRNPAWQGSLKTLFSRWQWAAITTLVALTGVVLYPALHESGHALAGRAMGVEVQDIVFTPLAGEEPHVRFGDFSASAAPWIGAGGVFLPIFVAYGLVLVWLLLGPRLARFAQAALLVPAVFLLFASFGVDNHLRPLAEHLGFTTGGGIMLVKLSPVLLTLAAYALIGWRIWRHARKTLLKSLDPAAPKIA